MRLRGRELPGEPERGAKRRLGGGLEQSDSIMLICPLQLVASLLVHTAYFALLTTFCSSLHSLHRLTITYKGEEVVNQEMGVVGGTGGDLLFSGVEIPSVELWWPHTMGSQPLYDVQVSFLDESLSWKAGVRTVETYIDENTEGRGFKVNGVEFFVQGGNWIATDAMLQRGSDERYGSEVMLHKFNGLNLIRVWGGGLPERPGFYRACDELGVMVFQEFWMSGDNNGRWGGEYDYPDDKEAYLEMVEDTVLRLREHTSLMFWGGGNELWPKGKSPPPVIASGLSGLISSYDDRFLIMSSMDGGYDGLDMSQHDDDFALAVKDGPYGFLDIQVRPGEERSDKEGQLDAECYSIR